MARSPEWMTTLARARLGGIVTLPMTQGLPSSMDAAVVAADPAAGTASASDPAAAADDRLMAAFCAGDEAAFARLYDRHAGMLLRFLRRLVGQRELAEDVLQTTFLSVVRARGRYQSGTSVRSWLYAIAANAARDALRRARVRIVEVRLPDAMGATDAVSDAGEPAEDDPALRAVLVNALATLPPDQREAVVLHHLEGLSFPEIASILGITAGAAKVRAHRGYERLRARLATTKKETSP